MYSTPTWEEINGKKNPFSKETMRSSIEDAIDSVISKYQQTYTKIREVVHSTYKSMQMYASRLVLKGYSDGKSVLDHKDPVHITPRLFIQRENSAQLGEGVLGLCYTIIQKLFVRDTLYSTFDVGEHENLHADNPFMSEREVRSTIKNRYGNDAHYH